MSKHHMRQMLRNWTNMSVIQAMDRIMFHTHLRISPSREV